jgi:hypothetical protein
MSVLFTNGSTQYAQFPMSPERYADASWLAQPGWTLTAWVKMNSPPGITGLIVPWESFGAVAPMMITSSTPGFLAYMWNQASYEYDIASVPIPTGAWCFCAVVIDRYGAAVRTWSRLKGWTSYIQLIAYSGIGVPNQIQTILVGNQDASSGRTFDGLISDACMWDKALTFAQLQRLALRHSPLTIMRQNLLLWADMKGPIGNLRNRAAGALSQASSVVGSPTLSMDHLPMLGLSPQPADRWATFGPPSPPPPPPSSGYLERKTPRGIERGVAR